MIERPNVASNTLTPDQEAWIIRASRRTKIPRENLREMIRESHGKCTWSKVPMLFAAKYGTAEKGKKGCHPLYATVDHTSPGTDDDGHELVCYHLNDIKGQLPKDCFLALIASGAWKRRISKWHRQASMGRDDHERLKVIWR